MLRADGRDLVVISGQAAIDPAGSVVGETIEEQAELTLRNCFTQLRSAGAEPADAFKVNVFVTDLALWSRFNAVYQRMMPEPRPARTAVAAGLLVEVELWAALDHEARGATKAHDAMKARHAGAGGGAA